jgi:hypothetical protein
MEFSMEFSMKRNRELRKPMVVLHAYTAMAATKLLGRFPSSTQPRHSPSLEAAPLTRLLFNSSNIAAFCADEASGENRQEELVDFRLQVQAYVAMAAAKVLCCSPELQITALNSLISSCYFSIPWDPQENTRATVQQEKTRGTDRFYHTGARLCCNGSR